MRLPLSLLAERYRANLYAAAFAVCRNPQDAEDAAQDVFLAYHLGDKQFESEQHIRAWLIRVAINRAKNATASFWRRRRVSLEDYMETLTFEEPGDRALMDAVLRLPERYRIAIHLYYYEDYSIREIAEIMKTREGTVKSLLSRGRTLLKAQLKEEWNDDEP